MSLFLGGSEWTQEDVIELNHVPLPEADCADLNDGPFEVKQEDSRYVLAVSCNSFYPYLLIKNV